MIHGLKRTNPPRGGGRKPGWRLLVPLLPLRRIAYSAEHDAFVDGVWWLSVGLSFEPIRVGDNPDLVGFSARLTWGWTTSARPAARA